MIEEPPFRNRIAAVLATLEARERRRRRAVIGGAVGLGLFVIGSLASIAYFSLIGHQHHRIEVHVGDAAYRIVSRTGPFVVESRGRQADLPIAPGLGGYLTEHLRGREVAPRSYLWAPMAETSQIVKLTGRQAASDFVVNGIPFHATASRLRTAGNALVGAEQWAAEPGAVVEVDLDRFVREARRR